MSMQSAADVPINVRSDDAAAERRVSPSWSIAQFKARLEPITGIPASSQRLALRLGPSQPTVAVEAADEDATLLAAFPLQRYAEIHVSDTRPPHQRTSYALTDAAAAATPKYEMPAATYENLSDSVLAFKRAHQLGRFDPAAPSADAAALARAEREVAERRIAVGRRARLLPATPGGAPDERRGEVRFVGGVPGLPGGALWVGLALDEPTGKNDGSVAGARYFECGAGRGVFVRPERVEVGEFKVLNELDEDMEEI